MQSLEPASPKRPVLGRAALIVFGATFALFIFFTSTNYLPYRISDTVRPIVAIAGCGTAIALAIASLVKRERKAPAIVALCLVVGSPALVLLVAMLVWWGYSLSL